MGRAVVAEPPRPVAVPVAMPSPARPPPPVHVDEKPAPPAPIATRPAGPPSPVGSFVPVRTGAEKDLFAVWTSGPNDVYVGGEKTFLRWNGSAWSEVPLRKPPEYVCAISGNSANDVWLLWNNWHNPNAAQLQHFDGRSWSDVDGAKDGTCDFRSMEILHHGFWASAPNDRWWANGIVWHGDGTDWSPLRKIIGAYVWGTSRSDV